MRQIFSAPAEVVETNPPGGSWGGVQCPGAPSWWLVVVTHWNSGADEDTWLAQTGVTEHYIENLGRPVPAAMVTTFGPWGITDTDTIREALRKIRAKWPGAQL